MPPTPAAIGLAILEMARAGRFAEIRERFAPALRPMVTAETLQLGWAAELDRCGPISSLGLPRSEPAGPGLVVVKIPVICQRGALTVVVSVQDTSWLVGIQVASATAADPIAPWEPPAYADQGEFADQDVTVGSGPGAVPGTLSLPTQPGPRPAIVLLAGSGPQDRDGTLGRNKPLKDLAWGLASCGIAVLRFDKESYAHPRRVRGAFDYTVADEYVRPARAALQLLRHHPDVDAGRIALLGHSQGGTLTPRVAALEPSLAGLVILAGGAQPLHWAAVRQVRYLASLDPASAAASKPALASLSLQAAQVDDPGLSPSTPASALPFGAPAAYWLDLRGYDPVAVAAGLGQPMLILQGGRDYQATVRDDLARWEAGLAGRPDVTICVYPHDNHLFFSGTGRSTPAEYEPVQHVDPVVVADVTDWLARLADTPRRPESEPGSAVAEALGDGPAGGRRGR
ncbi:MAG TPA: alpha/beta hydrolase [Verrucomicrobiae bacterium]|nr:alpha/beta hydrolase [Verrucomicrobiae bacterium]